MIIHPEDRAIIKLLKGSDAETFLLAIFTDPNEINLEELAPLVRMAYTVIIEKDRRFSSGSKARGRSGGAPLGNQNARKQPLPEEQSSSVDNNQNNVNNQINQAPKNNLKQASGTVPVSGTESVPDSGIQREREKPRKRGSPSPLGDRLFFGEFGNVLLTEDEKSKLDRRLGSPCTADYIEQLSAYIAKSGKGYKSHYAAILSWWRRDNSTPKPELEQRQGRSPSRYKRQFQVGNVGAIWETEEEHRAKYAHLAARQEAREEEARALRNIQKNVEEHQVRFARSEDPP